jgi:HAD superfamily hydrolase (TIGR01662 family)
MKIKLIIFDTWNTLLENSGDYRGEIAKILGLNKEYILDKFKEWNLINLSNEDFFRQITKDEKALQKALEKWEEANRGCILLEDVPDILKETKNRGIKICILSNATPNTFKILEVKGIKDYFDKVYLSCEYKIKKPSIKLFEIILNDFKISPEEAMMVGDKEDVDLEPAKELGIKTVLIDRKNQKTKEIADYQIDDLRKILNLLS